MVGMMISIRNELTVLSVPVHPLGIPGGIPTHTVEFEGFVASNFEVYVTKFAPHKAQKSIA